MLIARQSTAKTVTVGPVLDADGVAVTGGVVGDFKISKNGGAPAALDGSATLTHRHTGHYSLALTATDLATVGTAEVVIDDGVNTCGPKEITVVEEAVYDAFYAASAVGYVANAPVNVAQFGGSNGTFSSGRPEVNTTHLAGTSQTARDIGASVLLSSGTGTGQVKLASGYVAMTWADIAAPTTTVNLSGTTIATTQKVDVETIKTNPVVNAGTVTFPTGATLASTTNITAGTVTTATNVTTVNGLAANVVTAAAVADGAIDRAAFAADTGLQSARSNTAQAGSTTSITLDASASATTDFYKGLWVALTGGTGVGQARVVTAYDGTTKVATTSPAWATDPDNTSTFALVPAAGVDLTMVDGSAMSTHVAGTVPADLRLWKGSVPANLNGTTVQTTVNIIATGAITAAAIADGAIDAATFAAGAIDAAALAADAGTELATAVWAAGTRTLTSLSGLTVDTVTTVGTVNALAANSVTAAAAAADFGTEVGAAVWASAARTLTSLSGLTVDTVTTVNGLAANTVTASALAADAVTEIQSGLSTLTAAGVRTAVGLASANLDTQLDALPTAAENATAWGASVVGNSRTRDMYLQGLTNKILFAADGLTYTLYASDDTTSLASGTATRLSAAVGGLRGVDPT